MDRHASQPYQPAQLLPPFPWIRRVVLPLIAGIALAAAVSPLDKPISDAAVAICPIGDLRREIETLHQFGSFSTLIVVGVLILIYQRDRLRRTLDWILCAATGAILFNLIKAITGRARPELNDPTLFRGPSDFLANLSTYTYASIPSTHTTHAVIAAVFLTAFDRRLRFLVWPLVVIAATGRLLFGAHWPSDVLLAAGLAYAWASLWVHRYWGVRLIDFLWKLIFRNASPKFPEVYRREHAHEHAFTAARTP